MNSIGISNSVIKRLPRYYRFLGDLQNSGVDRISSKQLAEIMGLTASQIRQDFNCFGGFGQQGYGYNVEMLRMEIGKILGVDAPATAILIGVGNLGRAVAQHVNFESKGFQLIGIFDRKESLVGQIVRNMPIRSTATLDEFCKENRPQVAILCIPKENTKDIATQLINLGVKGFWNFSHFDLTHDNPDIAVENMHFGDSLMTLSYRLKNKE